MADVALLVVEQFERRRKLTEEDGIEAMNRMACRCVSYMGKKVEEGVVLLRDEAVVAKKALSTHHYPQTSAGLALFDGVFSA
ncbi:hypothetical protein ZOSMA_89G01110 [Zostera marina]|uniref:Uncharacterized protein n=1 Tax=Zostera marina TaxID=29655 RepID=A0A0K9NKM2_ZOSMR|nr:hypothetical protein ZOSMA_89G01110 [Zostera marina]